MTVAPRAVVVYRRTELDELLERHGTRSQAAFFLRQRGQSLDDVTARHEAQTDALAQVAAVIPLEWRRGLVERHDLDRFLFGPEDVVVAVGQDGLVANVAKYLDGQIVIGIDPEPGHNPGLLVRHATASAGSLLKLAIGPRGADNVEVRSMVEAVTDDGQTLLAVNEIFVGHRSHQSARYQISAPDCSEASERQSSSGLLVGTGTGATGWCRSVWQERGSDLPLPQPEELRLCWFVREAWPSPTTGTKCTEGILGSDEELSLVAESDLVVFGDGIESDAVSLTWGQSIRLRLAPRHLHLLT